MIASYKYNFIFLRTKKTASSAVALGLSTIAGPQDVVSPIGPKIELIRHELGSSPRNFARRPGLEARYLEATAKRDAKLMRSILRENRQTGGCFGHMSAVEARSWLGRDFWDRSFKFVTERHPYEKAISLAYMAYDERLGIPFPTFLDQIIRDSDLYRSFDSYSENGVPIIDGFLLHGDLEHSLAALKQRLGLPDFPLPRVRTNSRRDRRPAAQILDAAQKKIIREKCREEFNLFKWED